MNADEIVKELRETCTDNEYAPPMATNKMLIQAADLIESLQAELAAYEDTGLTPEQIQAQRQDIESLQRELNAEISVNEALTADKDEQARRIMQYDTVLRRAREALDSARGYTQYSADIRAKEAIESIDALLGGAEDGK